MKLVDVHETNLADRVLYDLLREREPRFNISHMVLPSFSDHTEFIESRPYHAWYLIQNEQDYIGSVYLTRDDEIGIFIFKKYHGEGWGPWAIEQIMEYHPREKYLANIAPMNQRSKKVFQKLGFRKLQEVYRYDA